VDPSLFGSVIRLMRAKFQNFIKTRFPAISGENGNLRETALAVGETVERFLHRYGWAVVVLFALLYYGQYYRSGLNFGGEGGTAGVLALRLMEGQRPIVDTFLGYNVMWFYPIVWLFDLVGPNYVALRVYFFAICTFGAVLGFLTLRRSTGCGAYALLVSSLLVLMPGMIFRNYMPFLGLVNMYVLLQAYVFSHQSHRGTLLWQAVAGIVLGLTFLVRIELGIFFSVINIGLALLYPLGFRGRFLSRLPLALTGIVLAGALTYAAHVPVFADARARGFDQALWSQYGRWLGFLGFGFKDQVIDSAKQAIPVPPVAAATPAPTPEAVATAPTQSGNGAASDADRNGLLRPSLREIGTLPSFYERTYVIITYLPILSSLVLLAIGSCVFAWSLWTGREGVREASLTVLTCVGASLTLFPQFFFFRPDTPHLSEFMAPFLVALGCGSWHVLRGGWALPGTFWRVGAVGIALLCLINAGLYTYHTMPKESGGTIGATKKKKLEFTAENGVRVLLSRKELEERKGVYDAVMKYTTAEDYVVCYPYAPTINFMTNRRSYEYNQYADNATETHFFHDETVSEIQKFRPAVIVIDNRDINKSDSSRFAIWAASSYQYIRSNYRDAGKFGRQEVYVRPDLFEAKSSAN